jgi:enterochelin esterase-like enzyme
MMTKLNLAGILAAILVFACENQSQAQTNGQSPGHVVELEVPAPALHSNLLETPTIQSAAVYLPPSYDLQPDRRFPVIYLLHGIFDDYGVWIEIVRVPEILDRLIANGEIPEVIVVMPNAGNRYGGGYYRNSPVSGNWEDYIAEDLVTQVDAQFRTIPSVESRAVVGHSMGGYGALNLAMNRPGVFSVVWALSPCCLAPNDDLSLGNDAWRRASAITEPGDLQALVDSRDFYPIAILGIVTAFSPDPEAGPIYGDFPFEIVRGEITLDGAAFDRFRDQFPVRRVHHARETLRDLRGLGMGVGLGDQFLHIPTGTLEFSQRLGAERIPHRLDIYDGDHRQHVGERMESIVFPWVAERLIATE